MAETFTVTANPIIEDRIASDLTLLRDAIVELIDRKHIRMLVLGGGFGRGEGTAFIANNQPHIVNDYDIRIVHDLPGVIFQARYVRQLNEIAEKFAQRLGIKQIDLGNQHYSKLSRISLPTIANYELIHGYHLFYGDDLLAQAAIHLPAERIPLWEGTWLLRNRSIGLILAGLYFLDGRQVGDEKRENLWIETNKAVLAVGDSFLLAKGRYHWSYVERGHCVAKWIGEEVTPWRKIYCRAVEMKVNPGGCPYDEPMDALIEGWYQARQIIEQGFCWYETFRTNGQWQSWADYLDHCIDNSIWKRPLFWVNLIRARTSSPVTAVQMARLRTERSRSVGLVARLLFAVTPEGIDQEAVDHVAQIVGIGLTGTPVARWRKLAGFVLSSIHPTGEAGRVAVSA